MPSLYTFTEYAPEWPRLFEQEAAIWRDPLGDEVVAIAWYRAFHRDEQSTRA